MDDTQHHGAPTGGAGVAAGWYADPAGAPVERWWDGTAWAAETRPHSALAQPLAKPVLKNTHATVGLVLGIAALLLNTFLVMSVAGLVFSILGLNRAGQLVSAGYAPVGRGRAIAGMLLSLLGGAGTVLFKALLF